MIALRTFFTHRMAHLNSWQVFPFLLVVVLLLYGNVLSYPFVHDDYVFIVDSVNIQQWNSFADMFFGKPSALMPDQDNANAYYRPLLDVANRFLFLIFGGVPRGYHLVNLLLHAANGLLAFSILRAMAFSPLWALGCSVLFLVHPVQSEAVCAIAGISNLLSSFFCFLSFSLYLRFQRVSTSTAQIFYAALAAISFFLGLLSKESTVVFPALIFLHQIFFSAQGTERKKVLSRSFFWGAFVLSLGYYFVLRQSAGIHLPILWTNAHELGLRLLSIPETFLMYVRILFVPFDLHYYRSVNILQPSFFPTVILLIVFGGYFFARRTLEATRRREADFGFVWFVVALAPTLNIVPLINEYALILTSEHFLYFPLFGFLIAVVVLGQRLMRAVFSSRASQVGTTVFIFVAVLLSLVAKEQSQYWQGEVPLFQRTLQYHPQFGRVRLLLGRAYYFNGNYDQAIVEYRKALEIMAGYELKTKGTKAYKTYQGFIYETYFEVAHCYEGLQQPREALQEYRKMLKLRRDDDRVYNNMGINYFLLKDFEKGSTCFRKALKINPRNMMAFNNLAFYYIQKGKFSRAEGILRKALRLDPQSLSLRQNLKEVVQARKDFQKAPRP